MVKKCLGCNIEKSLDYFHKQPKGLLGKASKCKVCVKQYRKELKEKKKKERESLHKDLTKKCTRCNKELLLNKFSKAPAGKYGRQPKCKQCYSAYYKENKENILVRVKDYAQDNKEKISQYQKQYREDNEEKLKNYRKEYYTENRDKIFKRAVEWVENNQERAKEYKKQYHIDNRDKILAKVRKWEKDNPEQYKILRRSITHRRRANIKNNGNNTLTAQEIADLLKSHLYCEYCGIKENLTIDHIIPISKGGQNCLSNVTVACGSCNSRKGNKIIN